MGEASMTLPPAEQQTQHFLALLEGRALGPDVEGLPCA